MIYSPAQPPVEVQMVRTLDLLKTLPKSAGIGKKRRTASGAIKRQGDTLLFTVRSGTLPPVIIYDQRKQSAADRTVTHKARMPFPDWENTYLCLSFLLLIALRKWLSRPLR